MKNFFVVLKGDFEAEVIIRLLKRNNQEFLVVEKKDWDRFDQLSDQVQNKILDKIGNKYQVYFVKFSMEVSGELLKKVEVINSDGEYEIPWQAEENTALWRIAGIVGCGITMFERLVVKNQVGYIFYMDEFIELASLRGQCSERSLIAMRDNVLRGEQVARGVTRRELSMAKVAVKNKKEYEGTHSRDLTVISLPTDKNGPVMDLLFSEYGYDFDTLLIKMKSGQLVFSSYKELTEKIQEKVQELDKESWTTKRETSARDRIFIKSTEMDIETIIRDYIVS